MNTQALGRRLLVTGVALLSCPLAISAPPAGQDPWAKVPPMPTTCYLNTDNFPDRHRAALEAVQADMDQQQKINDELHDRVKQMDPMEQSAKMQEYMMSHPQEAMKLMQQNQAVGETFSDAQVKSNENGQKLEAELGELEARYNATLDKALAPIKAKFKDLDARAQKDLVAVGESRSYAPWAVKEYNALAAQESKTYETICVDWWSATGAFNGWIRRYKEHLIQDEIPSRDQGAMVGLDFMVVLVGTPERPYKSTATMQAVIEYTRHGINLFGKRWIEPARGYSAD